MFTIVGGLVSIGLGSLFVWILYFGPNKGGWDLGVGQMIMALSMILPLGVFFAGLVGLFSKRGTNSQ